MKKHLLCIAVGSALLVSSIYAADTTNVDNTQSAQELAQKYQKLADKYKKIAEQEKTESKSKTDEQGKDNTETKTKRSGSTATTPITPLEQAKSKWDGTKATLGYTGNSGNTNSRNFTGGLNLVYKPSSPWTNSINSSYQYVNSDSDGTTVNKFESLLKSEYNFNKYNGVFGQIDYINSRFDGYVYQVTETLGYSRLLYMNNTMNVTMNIGPGLQQTRTTDTHEFKNLPNGLLAFNYNWNINDKTTFTESIAMNTTAQNTNTTSTTALTTTLYGNFALQTSFQWSFDSKPKTDKKNVNTTTQIALIYNF